MIARLSVPVPPAFVAAIVTEVAAAEVGVPVITPVPVFNESPAGSVPEGKLYEVGELLAVIE